MPAQIKILEDGPGLEDGIQISQSNPGEISSMKGGYMLRVLSLQTLPIDQGQDDGLGVCSSTSSGICSSSTSQGCFAPAPEPDLFGF